MTGYGGFTHAVAPCFSSRTAVWIMHGGVYANPGLRGGSNGGLLVGAALTQRQDLLKAVLCTYPLLDMVRYHRFLVAS